MTDDERRARYNSNELSDADRRWVRWLQEEIDEHWSVVTEFAMLVKSLKRIAVIFGVISVILAGLGAAVKVGAIP